MNNPERLSLAFAALADPTRRAILARLADGEATVADLASNPLVDYTGTFGTTSAELSGGETVLTGALEDQAAVYGVLAQIEALGLDLIELSRTGKSPGSGEGVSPG